MNGVIIMCAKWIWQRRDFLVYCCIHCI